MPLFNAARLLSKGEQNPETGEQQGQNPVHKQQQVLADQLLEARSIVGQYDLVTRLPAREQFLADLPDREALAAAGPLMLVTLSTPAHYNQLLRVLGHATADDFIRKCAERLMHVLPGDCSRVYHVSVMSFAFCLPGNGSAEPEQIAAAIKEAFKEPVICDDLPIDTHIGIGLLDTSRRSFDPAEALRATMTAAQAARLQEGNSPCRWYDRGTDEAFKRSFMLLTDLRLALSERPEQLTLHYQPRINLKTGRCTSAEALLRWKHPALGDVSPAEFVPLAEATALITPLTRHVMKQSISTLHDWQEKGLDIALSANISPYNLNEPDFVDTLMESLQKQAIKPGRFELEFTEGVLNENHQQTINQLNRLVDANIELAIDDFGSGYSNLSYLADLPAKVLKIDKSFVSPMDKDPQKKRLVSSIISLARTFDYRIVAEGVENKAILNQLQEWDCDEAQGYYIARPMKESDFHRWVRGRV